MTNQELTQAIIGAAIEVHRQLGPGLLESACEECLARELTLRPVSFERQKALPVVYKGVKLDCGYRLDLLAGDASLWNSRQLTLLRRSMTPSSLRISVSLEAESDC